MKFFCKKAFFVILVIFLTQLLFADNSPNDFVNSICNGLAQNKNTTGDFIQTKTIAESGRKLKSFGNFVISPYGIMWKTEKPFANTLIVTEDKMIQITAGGKKSVLDGSENQIFKNISAVLSSLFIGNSNELYKNFEISVLEENGKNGNWIIELSPKDSNISSVMKNFILTGKTEQNLTILNSLEIVENSNNKIKYEFSNQKYPQELTDDEKNIFTDNQKY